MERLTRVFGRVPRWAPRFHSTGRTYSTRRVQPGRWDPHVTQVKNSIPRLPNNKPYYIVGGASLIVFWYIFSSYLNNKERVSSSVLRMVSHRVRSSPEVHDLVGEPVYLKRSAFGDPWIEGIVNPLKGKVDMSFQIEGPQGVATVYFTSVRKHKADPFELLRFLVVPEGDSSRAVSLLSPGLADTLMNDS